MSNNVQIKCPDALKPIEYADGLSNVFGNINDNFELLSNHEFIKGDSGNSIQIIPEPFFNENDELTEIGQKLVDYISDTFKNELEPITNEDNTITYDIFSYFAKWLALTEEERAEQNLSVPSINMIYNVNNITGEKTLISSLYYVFFDGRYINGDIGDKIDESVYQNISDCSCILVWDQDINNFKSLNNSFPKITYEQGVGLCWQINGISTGLPIRGKSGKDGVNASISIVKATKTDENNIYKVNSIYNYLDGYLEISSIEDYSKYDNTSAIAFIDHNAYVGMLFINYINTNDPENPEEQELMISIDTENSLNGMFGTQNIIDAFKEIDINNTNDKLKGLFIPMQQVSEDSTSQEAHFISTTSVLNEINNKIKNDLIIAPVNDINTVSSLNTDDLTNINKLGIEKYLYLKINEKSNIFNNNIISDSTNYYLKYKLTNSGVIPASTDCYYGTNLEESNTCFKNNGDDKDHNPYVTDHLKSLPNSVQKNIDGLYRWELYNDASDFDIDELKFIDSTASLTNYGFDSKFNVIYTDTLTPSVDTHFMWFNGMSYDDIYNGKYVIPGWSDTEVLSFVKLVPIYRNIYNGKNVALNINYNVNITGSDNDPYKNLNVHGSIAGNDVNVYGELSAKKINNIYTEDTIVTTDGIKIGEYLDDDGNVLYNAEISSEGAINGTLARFNNIDIDNFANIEHINSNITDTNRLNITPSQLASFNISESNVNKDAVGITATNVNEITLYAADNKIKTISDAPIVTSNIPAHLNDNSNIVLSNQTSDSDQIYFKNTLTDSSTHRSGNGVSDSEVISATSFESAKNFNMHRLSISVEGSETTTNKEELSCSRNNISSPIIPESNNTSLSTSIDKIYNKSDTNFALQKVTLNGVNLSSSNTINMTFDNYFKFTVGIKTKCDNGYRACLNSASYVKLKLAYSIDGSSLKFIKSSTVDYKFSSAKGNGNATTSTKDDNGYEWIGYDENNNAISNKNYDEIWRYYTYVLKPFPVLISNGTDAYNEIMEALNKGGRVEFSIIPEIYIKTHSQYNNKDNRKLIRDISVSNFTPIIRTGIADKQISKISPNAVNDDRTEIGKITYYEKEINSNSSIKSTTICNDGIVMRAGDYVFGLGYTEKAIDYSKSNYNKSVGDGSHWKTDYTISKIPVLFYHKYDPDMYKNAETTNLEGYAARTNAVPLEDIFKCIKFLRNKFPEEFDSIGI